MTFCQLVVQQNRVNIGDGDMDHQQIPSEDDEETPCSPIIPLLNSVSKKVMLFGLCRTCCVWAKEKCYYHELFENDLQH